MKIAGCQRDKIAGFLNALGTEGGNLAISDVSMSVLAVRPTFWDRVEG